MDGDAEFRGNQRRPEGTSRDPADLEPDGVKITNIEAAISSIMGARGHFLTYAHEYTKMPSRALRGGLTGSGKIFDQRHRPSEGDIIDLFYYRKHPVELFFLICTYESFETKQIQRCFAHLFQQLGISLFLSPLFFLLGIPPPPDHISVRETPQETPIE